MLVYVVVATLPDNSGMDTSRMNRVEDLDPEIARAMLNSGTAREPSEDELAEYRGENPEPKSTDGEVAPGEGIPGEPAPGEREAAEQADEGEPATDTEAVAEKPARAKRNGNPETAGDSQPPTAETK